MSKSTLSLTSMCCAQMSLSDDTFMLGDVLMNRWTVSQTNGFDIISVNPEEDLGTINNRQEKK